MSSRACAATRLNLEDITLLDAPVTERLTLPESTYMGDLEVTFIDSKSGMVVGRSFGGGREGRDKWRVTSPRA